MAPPRHEPPDLSPLQEAAAEERHLGFWVELDVDLDMDLMPYPDSSLY